MDAKEIIAFIQNAEKKTPVKVYLKEKKPVAFPDCKVFGTDSKVIFGDWKIIEPILKENAESIEDMVVENDCRNSAVPLLDKKYINARIEPGAVIRDQVEIGDNAVIMMGAIINIGAIIGEGTMIDMGAVLGGRATVGKHCHIGAGAVLAGVIEPASATPVIVEDDVLIGANAVVIEGVHIGKMPWLRQVLWSLRMFLPTVWSQDARLASSRKRMQKPQRKPSWLTHCAVCRI